ncbi:MAG TPA: hypothetical protein VIK72_13390 [Clostridiaceae bacterium]
MRTYIVKEDGICFPNTINVFTTTDKQEATNVMKESNGRWIVVCAHGVPIGVIRGEDK